MKFAFGALSQLRAYLFQRLHGVSAEERTSATLSEDKIPQEKF